MITLRGEIAALLPPKTFLRIDRTGRALYAAAIDDEMLLHLRESGWVCTPAGSICLIAPGAAHLEALRAHAAPSPQWQRFAALPADEALLPLLTALLRAAELPPPTAVIAQLEKQLRQAAAVALRTGAGGGLELCETLLQQIKS